MRGPAGPEAKVNLVVKLGIGLKVGHSKIVYITFRWQSGLIASDPMYGEYSPFVFSFFRIMAHGNWPDQFV